MTPQAGRIARREGKSVTWANYIGHMPGQSGTYKFATEAQALTFEDYAQRSDFPPINADLLAEMGLEVVKEE